MLNDEIVNVFSHNKKSEIPFVTDFIQLCIEGLSQEILYLQRYN